LFVNGTDHLLGERKIDEAVKTINSLLDSTGWGMQKRIKKDHVTMSWFSEECKQKKEEALRALRKWKNEKTKENGCKYVEKRIQYKVIIENEKKMARMEFCKYKETGRQERQYTNMERNKEPDTTKGRGYEIDPGRVREYFWRLLGGEEMELGVHHIHPPTMRNRNVLGLLFADGLAVGTTTSIGMQ
jgi:hypothetical protein